MLVDKLYQLKQPTHQIKMYGTTYRILQDGSTRATPAGSNQEIPYKWNGQPLNFIQQSHSGSEWLSFVRESTKISQIFRGNRFYVDAGYGDPTLQEYHYIWNQGSQKFDMVLISNARLTYFKWDRSGPGKKICEIQLQFQPNFQKGIKIQNKGGYPCFILQGMNGIKYEIYFNATRNFWSNPLPINFRKLKQMDQNKLFNEFASNPKSEDQKKFYEEQFQTHNCVSKGDSQNIGDRKTDTLNNICLKKQVLKVAKKQKPYHSYLEMDDDEPLEFMSNNQNYEGHFYTIGIDKKTKEERIKIISVFKQIQNGYIISHEYFAEGNYQLYSLNTRYMLTIGFKQNGQFKYLTNYIVHEETALYEIKNI